MWKTSKTVRVSLHSSTNDLAKASLRRYVCVICVYEYLPNMNSMKIMECLDNIKICECYYPFPFYAVYAMVYRCCGCVSDKEAFYRAIRSQSALFCHIDLLKGLSLPLGDDVQNDTNQR